MNLKNKKICIVSTSNELFWDDESVLLFLDKGCIKNSQKKKLGNREYFYGRTRWEQQDDFESSFEYLHNLKERLVESIGNELCILHGENYDIKSKRILLGWWLERYLGGIYYKYEMIRELTEKYVCFSYGCRLENEIIPYNTFDSCMLQGRDDNYNAYLGTRIMEYLRVPICKYVSVKIGHFEINEKKRVLFSFRKIRKFVVEILSFRGKKVCDSYCIPSFPKKKKVAYYFKSGIRFCTSKNENVDYQNVEINYEARKKIACSFLPQNEFERMLVSFVKNDIPLSYIEKYDENLKLGYKLYGKKKRAFFSKDAWYYNEIAKIYISHMRSEGLKLFGIQHGGTSIYRGDILYFDSGCCDYYFSWGWNSANNECRIIPMPSIKLSGELSNREEGRKRDGVLYVGTCAPRYVYDFRYPHTVNVGYYIDWQVELIEKFNHSVNNLKVRLYQDDYGWEISDRIKERDADVFFEDWSVRFVDAIKNASICVFDIMMTSWTEAYTLDIPFIIVTPKEFEFYDVRYEKIVKELKRVGVYHNSIDEAINLVLSIENDIDGWWANPERKEVVCCFANEFAKYSADYREEWRKVICAIN